MRSSLERKVATALEAKKIPYDYEPFKIEYEVPARQATYTPDFVIGSIVIEAKGHLKAADRQKHILIKEQTDHDIRFVFGRARNSIYKGSPTSYADWAEKHGFQWAEGEIPDEWLEEANNISKGKEET